MTHIIIQVLISAVGVILGAYLLKGVTVDNFLSALLTAILLAVVNTFVKPVLLFITLPVNVLTLGLFTWVINALLLLLVDFFVPGLKIKSFWWALLFAIVISVFTLFAAWIF